MTVTLTSQVLGLAVGASYTGNLEPWLLAEGYAKQANYTGPGVSNTGATDILPANDPTRAANREAPYFPSTPDRNTSIANDEDNLNETSFQAPDFDFDAGGTDTESPSDLTLEPSELELAGGSVLVTGNNLEGVTAVTVGGTAVTDLDLDAAGDGVITFTAPAKTAGAHDVVFTDASGNATVSGGLTYSA